MAIVAHDPACCPPHALPLQHPTASLVRRSAPSGPTRLWWCHCLITHRRSNRCPQTFYVTVPPPPLHATTQPPKLTAGDTVVSSLDCPHPPPRAALSGYHVPSNKNECAETRTLCFNRKLKIFQERGKTIHSSLEYLLELNVAASKIQGKGYSNLKIRKKEP
jgi:hypothetical protein